MNKNIWLILIFFLCLFGCKKDEPQDIKIIASKPNLNLMVPIGLFDTQLHGYWVGIPDVRICPGAGISRTRVREAISFWEGAGYRFGRIIAPPNNGIPCSAHTGEIAFRVPTQDEISEALHDGLLGVAKTQIIPKNGEIIASNIYFQSQVASHTPKIVEHELGHALGWKHHTRKFHIMHPLISETGYLYIGMEKSRYDVKTNGFQPLLREQNE
jgi:hypothetical protein